ncbi:uncharacterized protein LOC34621212 [Cyclospora cayetanensis]|uniref:Uncharacterized protein LOC34621212 n=1 Tax=Cyclospora cayetanensis TaxID=88456 RepID=A0A6P6RXX2_9EIME|nr:uncharacterized protein LOC34621212 [Cyclospora cayetanensis]
MDLPIGVSYAAERVGKSEESLASDSASNSGCESGSIEVPPRSAPLDKRVTTRDSKVPLGSTLAADAHKHDGKTQVDTKRNLHEMHQSKDAPAGRRRHQQRQPGAGAWPSAGAVRASSVSKATGSGTACLAPRRLRSKAPPRVAWVNEKFMRELASDDQRAPQLPVCASFVYSFCHVEGYNIRAVHQDALQKRVQCRFLGDADSVLMLEVDDSLHLADPKARSQEAFEATCGFHGPMSGFSDLEVGVHSCTSAVLAVGDGDESNWGPNSPLAGNPSRVSVASNGCTAFHYSSSEIEAAAAGGARLLRRGMRSLSINRQRYDATNVTVAFIFEKGPVIMWVAASDRRAQESRGRRELLSSLLFFLSQFATRFIRADMVQEDVMRYTYIRQVRKQCPAFEVPKTRILQDCIYLKTESVAEKLAASFALSQSIRLSVYESLINFTIARVRAIPERMARFGSAEEEEQPATALAVWTLVRRCFRMTSSRTLPSPALMQPLAWSCLCGDLLGKVVDVNIVQDFRDVPEYFWNDDTWQHFWARLYSHLEIQKRINLLNNRYFCIHELLKVVREERRTRQEFRMTWIIVFLLFFQVIALVLRNFVIHPYME